MKENENLIYQYFTINADDYEGDGRIQFPYQVDDIAHYKYDLICI